MTYACMYMYAKVQEFCIYYDHIQMHPATDGLYKYMYMKHTIL